MRKKDTITSQVIDDSSGSNELCEEKIEATPRYERDDGPLTEAEIESFKKASGIDNFVPTKSIFH